MPALPVVSPARHRRLRRDDLRPWLDELAAAGGLARRSGWCSTSGTAEVAQPISQRGRVAARIRALTTHRQARFHLRAGPRLAVALLAAVVLVGGTARLHAHRGLERVGRVLHDGHHGDDGRLPGSPPAVARRRGCSRSCCSSAASERRFTPSRSWRPSSSRAGCPSGFASGGVARMLEHHQGSFHRLRLRTHRQHRRRPASAPGRAVRRHRARPGADAQAAMMDGLLAVAGRRQPRRRAEARRHRAGARADCRRRHRRRERVHRAERARAAAGSLHRRPRGERGRRRASCSAPGANRVISPYQIGAVQMAQTALRPAVVDFVELATSSDNLELAMEEITVAERLAARRAVAFSTRTCASASA